jgi:N-acetylneuraminate synthase
VGAKTAWQALGKIDYGLKSSEKSNIKFRRSLYFIKDIKEGEVITKDHVKSIRPGYGLPPKNLDRILQMTCTEDVKKGTAVSFNFLREDL